MNDPDEAYERMRENEADRLENALKEVLKAFYLKSPYYSGSKDKLKNHAINAIEWWEGD